MFSFTYCFICSSRFCLDNQRSLDRDQAFVRLQSRLIRYETQTTCSKEPCALPFALSPAPSPAVMSEPGSVPDGETLQNADVARLKRRSWDTDVIGGYSRKRYDGCNVLFVHSWGTYVQNNFEELDSFWHQIFKKCSKSLPWFAWTDGRMDG